MGRLIYSMITSADGYVRDADGAFDWGVVDEDLHSFVTEQFGSVRTYLYGRHMYETMVYWETAHEEPGQPEGVLDYAKAWRAADKYVYSTTLTEISSERTHVERQFDPDAVRRLKADTEHDLTIDGPTLAAHAIAAGLVDEYALIIAPTVAGGGLRFFPDGVRLDLELVESRRFDNGTVFVRYVPAGGEAQPMQVRATGRA